jgi:ABC-type uncharacterized transport system substrate-binding protein
MDRVDHDDSKEKKRTRHLDRITVNQEALEKLNNWITQIDNENKGVHVSRTDLVNWVLENEPDQLSPSQLKEIQEGHYDPVKYARWAYAQVKAAKARGENVTIQIIEGKTGPTLEKPKRAYRRKNKSDKEDLDLKEARDAEEEASLNGTSDEAFA